MNIVDRKYGVAGFSRDPEGTVKIRYSESDIRYRVDMYVKKGHTDVEFFDLPEPMNKVDICKYILQKFADNADVVEAATIEMGKKVALVKPATPKKRGRPPKAAVVASKITSKPKVKLPPMKKVKEPVKEIGEVETLEVTEDFEDDFDVRQFEKIAAEQV